jgi:hypothetical protein
MTKLIDALFVRTHPAEWMAGSKIALIMWPKNDDAKHDNLRPGLFQS